MPASIQYETVDPNSTSDCFSSSMASRCGHRTLYRAKGSIAAVVSTGRKSSNIENTGNADNSARCPVYARP